MGISFSIPFDPCVNKVSQWIDVKVAYTRNLKKNLEVLETTMEELKAKRDSLSRRVTREEDRGLQRLAGVQVWLGRVVTTETEVNDLLTDGNAELQRLCLCGFCSKSFLSSYRYGKSVFLTLRKVEKLKNEVFEVIVEQASTSEVEERQLQPTIVGQETMLDKTWNHLSEDGVGIMGLYGMGGVGKTTLLTQIHNMFSNNRSEYDFVFWVVVSKELHVEKILDEITEKVGLGKGELNQKERSQKAVSLYNFLRKKRFVLFLDDIWEKVDLAEIGVPFPTRENRCKVAFTTRSQDVCSHMGVEDPMEVQCLVDNDAFDLFKKKVGKITLGSDPGILDLARIVAKKCCGLPLALNVIGETMSCKRTIQEWSNAIDVLTSYAAEFSGMDDKILPLLKYSYDSLKKEHVKSGLLYCALFPEDARISKEILIEHWICEGIIDEGESIERAENKGYEIIGNLVRASLLMESAGHDQPVVHMHDVVREMALWIASELGIQKEAFIVRAGVELHQLPKINNWNVVRRMSLMNSMIHHLHGSPKCMELTTLLMQEGRLNNISSEFFRSMPKLVVLNLSGNRKLFQLPEEISELVSLQYLNLSFTGIRNLPEKGLQELQKLIHLDLETTRQLSSIVGISNVHNLKVLKLAFSGLPWDINTLKELEALEHLQILTITMDRPPGLEQLLVSHRLLSCTRSLTISNYGNLKSSGISLGVPMDKLRDVSIERCSISEIKMGKKISSFLSLVEVRIENCECLRELTFLKLAPNLKTLYVKKANQLEDVIEKEKACGGGIVPFPKLSHLHLEGLPELKNIYWSPLPFPCLKEIWVKNCLNLKKLPLDSKSCDNGLIIRFGGEEWIEDVEWEDEATKTRFLSSCLQIDELNIKEKLASVYGSVAFR